MICISPKSQPVANGWLLAILDFNTHKTIAQDSDKSHHVHPERSPRQQSLQFGMPELWLLAAPAGGLCKNKLMFSRMPFVEICPESIGGIAV